MATLDRFRHPAWGTAVATGVAYGLVLLLFTVVLFAVPYLLFTAL